MRQILLLWLISALLFICCQRRTNFEGKPVIDTKEEIHVYNAFIDQVYNIYYCHLEKYPPKREDYSLEEYHRLKNEFDSYISGFNAMLDTLQIMALVNDSLDELEFSTLLFSHLDTSTQKLFNGKFDSLNILEQAFYDINALKSEKIEFEKISYDIIKPRDWSSMPLDTINKYRGQINDYADKHFGNRIDNRYYIGQIRMSRVKFSYDSTLCVLQCGYVANQSCGYGHYYFLRKVEGKWIIVEKTGSWMI